GRGGREPSDRRLPPALARRRPRGVAPEHAPHRRGDRLGGVRRLRRADGRVDVLARAHPAPAVGPPHGRDRRAVGEARLAPAAGARERPATLPDAERLLPRGGPGPPRHRARPAQSPGAVGVLPELPALPRVHRAASPRPPPGRGTARRAARGARHARGVRLELLAQARLAV
ncbi:MAG: hypothetical protein AVDCRST_MAG11-1041, partial [uncultured Gemmatimonadaceae bacterium]